MEKHILLLGAGRSATVLIEYLKHLVGEKQWLFTVADNNLQLVTSKLGNSSRAIPVQLDVADDEKRTALVEKADLVISLLPPPLHFIIAQDCLRFRKHLLTASYVDEKIRAFSKDIAKANILFLCEMGLDPGIDHMSAMRIIHKIHADGGRVISFRSHCGGLVAPESDNNPWHYKISWNAANVVKAGVSGAVYREDGKEKEVSHGELFQENKSIEIPGYGALSYYPNRDSLSYIPVYGLNEVSTFLRTTLRHPTFLKGWSNLIKAGLTSDQPISRTDNSFEEWSRAILPFVDEENKELYVYLGLFESARIPSALKTNAEVLQFLIENKLMLQDAEKDMVIMVHEFLYEEKNGDRKELKSTLLVKGLDHIHTAMAKTVGLPLGIAAKFILEGKIQARGLHIPVTPEIYEPVLEALEAEGICFHEEIKSENSL